MPKYRVFIEREYTIIEGFYRDVEALDKKAAREQGDELADEADGDCPDDCSESGDAWAGDFRVSRVVTLP